MRWLPTITLTSFLIVIISVIYYFTDNKPTNYFIRKKREKIEYKTFRSLDLIAEEKKKMLIEESKKFSEIESSELDGEEKVKTYSHRAEEICKRGFTALEGKGDFMMESSPVYETFASLHVFINKIKNEIDFTGVEILQELEDTFEEMYTYGGKYNSENIFQMGTYHAGCADGDSLGLVILAAAERIKAKGWVPNDFINLVGEMAALQVRFNSYTSLVYAVGMLSNLNSVNIFTEYETYDLNSLREDIIKQSMEFRENLRNAKSEDEKLEILQNARLEREIAIQMVLDFVSGVKSRYPKI